MLRDEISEAKTTIKSFHRDDGDITLTLDAPEFVKIMREHNNE
ncbi:MAG: hypothetical protein ACYS1A_02035 [Planctomycetota bacterium]